MKNNLIILLVLLFSVAGCSGSKRIKSLVEFTPRLIVDSNKPVNLGQALEIDVFGNENNFIQNMGNSLILKPILPKNYKKINLSKNNIIGLPSVANSTIYALDDAANLVSVDIKSNKTNWNVSLSPEKKRLTSGSLVYYQNKLYIIGDLQLFEIDAKTGKEITRRSFKDLVRAQPVAMTNALFIQNVSNNLTAYNTETWMPAWTYETWPETLASHHVSSPIIAGSQIISSYTTGQIVANNLVDGAELWQMNLYRESDAEMSVNPQNATCQPLISGKYLYVASNNGFFIKIDITNASIVWKKPYQDIISLALSGNTIFLTNNARQIAAIDTDDGGVIWTSDLINLAKVKNDKIKPTTFLTPIITSDNVIILSKDKEAFIIDAKTGGLQRYFEIPKNIISFGIDKQNLILFDRNSAYMIN